VKTLYSYECNLAMAIACVNFVIEELQKQNNSMVIALVIALKKKIFRPRKRPDVND